MKRFKSYLREQFLLEYKEWHQFIKHNGDSILGKMGHSENYAKLSSESGHGTPEHKTNYIKTHLGISDMSQEHGRWVLGQLQRDNIENHEDIPTSIATNLKKFDQLKSDGKITANIKKVQNPKELYNLVSKEDEKDDSFYDENEHWTVHQPTTSKAACALGANTKWCTTSKGFDSYNKKGPLYIFTPKKPYYAGEKYQYHKEYGEFMDEKDEPIYYRSVEKGPAFASRPSPLGKEHPSSIHDAIFSDYTSEEDFEKLLKHKHFTPELITPMLTSKVKYIADAAVNHKMFGTHDTHIEAALKSKHPEIQLAAIEHPKFVKNTENIIHALKSQHKDVQLAALKHPDFARPHLFGFHDKIIETAIESEHPEVQLAAIRHPNFKNNTYSFYVSTKSKHPEVQKELRQRFPYRFEHEHEP
jgi:hypothetical protein